MTPNRLGSYVGAYRDFSPHGWAVKPSTAPQEFEVRLPNGFLFQIDDRFFPIEWWKVFDYNHVTTRLWHRSLCYLPLLAREAGGWQRVSQILVEFLDLMKRAADEPTILGMNSLDHAIALQLRSLCALRAQLHAEPVIDLIDIDALDAIMVETVALLEVHARSEGFRLVNNHGIMLGLALMHSQWVFDDVLRDESQLADDERWLLASLDEIVDQDGIVFENTPQYQRLYIDAIEQISEVARDLLGDRNSAQSFALRFARVVEGYRHLISAHGTVPAIGDAQRTKDHKYTYVPGVFVSPGNGIYVRNTSRAQLAISSGCRSHVHKHMDDSAIRLLVDDIDVVIDGGLINYDSGDPDAVAVRGQLGHSGLFFREFDTKPCHWFYPAGAPAKVDASLVHWVGDDGRDVVDCRYIIGSCEAQRRIEVLSATDLVVTDRCWGPAEAVQRFLIPPSSTVAVSSSSVVASIGEGLALRVEAMDVSTDTEWTIGRAAVGLERMRSETWVLERPVGAGGEPVRTRLSVVDSAGNTIDEGGLNVV
ncbi:heparinase II/III family protein [Oerskovia sp. Sa1BUA8]|uniref:Heparinase II/III family protein n=1 Tax=Oerskovia douganii TaxID=2762210 RepID=A0A9D5UEC9_9CELL|nr:heparinase II/III family protein [Oerskovia douganii]MBE7701496.1 heparinase II/III family protein [Oerskovia douganii]